MQVTIDIDLEKLRYSLVGDGYLLCEVEKMTEKDLVDILTRRINYHIKTEYYKSVQYGLLSGERE